MIDITKLKELEGDDVVYFLFLGLGLFLPGLLFFYIQAWDDFKTLSFGKILLISFIYSFPIFITFLIAEVYLLNNKSKKNKNYIGKESVLIASILTTTLSMLSIFLYKAFKIFIDILNVMDSKVMLGTTLKLDYRYFLITSLFVIIGTYYMEGEPKIGLKKYIFVFITVLCFYLILLPFYFNSQHLVYMFGMLLTAIIMTFYYNNKQYHKNS